MDTLLGLGGGHRYCGDYRRLLWPTQAIPGFPSLLIDTAGGAQFVSPGVDRQGRFVLPPSGRGRFYLNLSALGRPTAEVGARDVWRCSVADEKLTIHAAPFLRYTILQDSSSAFTFQLALPPARPSAIREPVEYASYTLQLWLHFSAFTAGNTTAGAMYEFGQSPLSYEAAVLVPRSLCLDEARSGALEWPLVNGYSTATADAGRRNCSHADLSSVSEGWYEATAPAGFPNASYVWRASTCDFRVVESAALSTALAKRWIAFVGDSTEK